MEIKVKTIDGKRIVLTGYPYPPIIRSAEELERWKRHSPVLYVAHHLGNAVRRGDYNKKLENTYGARVTMHSSLGVVVLPPTEPPPAGGEWAPWTSPGLIRTLAEGMQLKDLGNCAGVWFFSEPSGFAPPHPNAFRYACIAWIKSNAQMWVEYCEERYKADRKIPTPFQIKRQLEEWWKEARKRAIAKHGYSVVAPHWRDIIKIPWHPNITKEDRMEFAKAKIEGREPNLPAAKIDYLEWLWLRKERLLRSPVPDFIRSYSALLTTLDDIEDGISTAYAGSWLLFRFAPRLFGKLIPVLGWMQLASDVLNTAQKVSNIPMSMLSRKKVLEDLFNGSCLRKRKCLHITDMKALKAPNLATLLEAAQVSSDAFGVGLQFGAIFGYPYEVAAGLVRTIRGEKVSWKHAFGKLQKFELKVLAKLAGIPLPLMLNPVLDDDLRMFCLLGQFLGTQFALNLSTEYDFIENFDSTDEIEITPPRPQQPDSIALLEKYGFDPNEPPQWPYLNKEWARIDELQEAIGENANRIHRDFLIRRGKDDFGYLASQMTDYAAEFAYKAIAGEDHVRGELPYDQLHAIELLRANMVIDLDNDPEALRGWWDHCNRAAEYQREKLAVKDILELARSYNITITSKQPTTLDPRLSDIIPDLDQTRQALEDIGYL